MNCTNCKKEINDKGVKKSAKIPRDPKCHYICCDCGNVMMARFKNGKITKLYTTPTDPNEKTFSMMKEAQELFNKLNINPMRMSLTKDGKQCPLNELIKEYKNKKIEPEQEDPEDDEDEDPIEEEVENVTSKCNGECNSYEQCPYYKEVCDSTKKPSRFLGKIMKFISFFKK